MHFKIGHYIGTYNDSKVMDFVKVNHNLFIFYLGVSGDMWCTIQTFNNAIPCNMDNFGRQTTGAGDY